MTLLYPRVLQLEKNDELRKSCYLAKLIVVEMECRAIVSSRYGIQAKGRDDRIIINSWLIFMI